MSAERFLCAEQARARQDSIAGTAAPTRTWLLIEYRGRWPFEGFSGLDIDLATKIDVTSAAQSVGARVLLIRRPGRVDHDRPQRWAVLTHDRDGIGRQTWGTWQGEDDLAAIPDAFEVPGQAGLPSPLLVCTHGLHDTCCAIRGRPVAAALADRWPELTWECSHVGGDRFAANLVVAPDGVYYGEVDPDQAIAVIEDQLADRIRPEHLRGYTTLTPPQQVAVIEALRAYGPAGRYAWRVLDTARHGDRWTIHLAGRAPLPARVEVELIAERTAAHRLTCRAHQAASVINYRPAGIRELPGVTS